MATIYKIPSIYALESTSAGANMERPKGSIPAIGDSVYADADGGKHFIITATLDVGELPAGYEYVGPVAYREKRKAYVLYKTENTSVRWASMWLFKVNGLKLDGTDTFVLQQGTTSGTTMVEIGTFTASAAATDLDTLVLELDTWLRANPTATGALANYNWHAEKHVDANGVESCFIVVDNANTQARFNPIKSSSSGASAVVYMWDWCGFLIDGSVVKRKDGVNTYAVVWNKERFKANNTNVNGPTDSLTTEGLFNEANFNTTTIVKDYYETYDNYLDNMVPDEKATTGAYAMYKGKGKEVEEALARVVFPNLSGTDTAVFPAEVWASSIKAHSSASVEGLNAGDFFVPSIDIAYKIFSKMKTDGSDPVNYAIVKAGESAFALNNYRHLPVRYLYYTICILSTTGAFGNTSTSITSMLRCCAVAELDF